MIDSTEDNPTQPISNEAGDVSQTTLQSINLNNNEGREDGKRDNVEGTGSEEKPDVKNGALDDKCPETSNNLEINKNIVYNSDAMEPHLGKDNMIGDEAEVTQIDEVIIKPYNDDKKQLERVEESLKDDVTIDKSTYEKMLSDQKRLKDELKRLKEHLIMVEDDYTTEILELETREANVKNELNQALETISQLKAKSHTGFSHDQNFSEQLEKLKEERDRALDDVSKLDDKVHSLTASVTNLQLVIEQIQKENEKKIKSLAKQHEAAIESEHAIQNELRQEIEIYEKRSIEASQALQAATRLTENIDNKEKIIQNLKQELSDKDQHISKLEMDIANLKTSFEGKVDKQVIKNLILGYFGTPNDKKHEVERLLARVLDFNEEEMSRAGLSFGRQPNKFTVGPINLANSSDKVKSTATGSVLVPSQKLPASNSAIASPGSAGLDQSSSHETNPDSLSKMFVEFLEAESRPKGVVANSSVSPLTRELARDFTKVALNSSAKKNLLESTLSVKNKMSPIAITSSSSSSSSSTTITATNTSSLPLSSSFSSLVTTRGLQQQTANHILSTNGKSLNPILAPAHAFASNKLGNNFSGSHSPIRPITINSSNLLDHDQSINTDFSTSTSSSSSSSSSTILNSIPSLNTFIKPTNFESNQIVSLSSSSSSSALTSLSSPSNLSPHFMPETTSQTSPSTSSLTTVPVTLYNPLISQSIQDYNSFLSNSNLRMKKG